MNITTTFSCGDKGWVYWGEDGVRQLTVGQVQVIVTNSPGVNGNEIFDNYSPKSGSIESCMCVETGIGTGTCYTVGKSIFVTKDECIAANEENIERAARDAASRKEYERERLLGREALLRRQLAEIEAAKAGTA